METSNDKFYTVKEFAEILHFDYQTIIRMIKRNELSAAHPCGRWRIPQSELDRIKELCNDRK
jgi:excisionase family DNA binding protein